MYYGGYTLTVPVLVSLTDRIDPKRIYLAGVGLTTLAMLGYALFADGFWPAVAFRTLMGIGWAGSYMPGLTALRDQVDVPRPSRAVAAHAPSVGTSGPPSVISHGLFAPPPAWRWRGA